MTSTGTCRNPVDATDSAFNAPQHSVATVSARSSLCSVFGGTGYRRVNLAVCRASRSQRQVHSVSDVSGEGGRTSTDQCKEVPPIVIERGRFHFNGFRKEGKGAAAPREGYVRRVRFDTQAGAARTIATVRSTEPFLDCLARRTVAVPEGRDMYRLVFRRRRTAVEQA